MSQGQNPQQYPYQAGYGQQQGQPQYGYQAPGQGGQQGYPQQGHPQQQGYPQQQPGPQQGWYPNQPGYGVQQQPTRSPLLGMIALGGVVICAVVLCWLMWRTGAVLGPLAAQTGGNLDQQEATEYLIQQLGGTGLALLNGATLGGIAFWILGIVATSMKRGRSYGVWSIILGILAPVVAIIVLVAAIVPYVS